MRQPIFQIFLLTLFIYFVLSGCRKNITLDEEPEKTRVDSVYNWVCNMQQKNGLLLTNEDGRYASLYDNALAALIYIAYGDKEKAERIFDFFDNRIDSELLKSPGGFGQLRASDGVPVDNKPRRWMGDNAWLLIAVNYYQKQVNSTRYDRLAKELSSWLLSLQDIDGGIWGGFEANGTQIPKITEGNIDAFNAIEGYTKFHQNILLYLKNAKWDHFAKLLIASAENLKYRYALDLHSWGYCVFEDFPMDVLLKTDRFLTIKQSTQNQLSITGYCFDEDKDVVWLEGSGQMVISFMKAKRESDAQKYLKEIRKNLVKSKRYTGVYGLPYTANFGTSFGSENLWTSADTTPSVSSTVWYLFGMLRFDPLESGYTKNIPVADKFWLH